ncbi:MAG: hydantoinase B/oxoprolinase family protein [Planctomycetota bacterium]|nr:hydantoinase B/oxoprolinase family protein [Planctomycetota bacterium]
MSADSLRVQVFHHLLAAACEEMGAALLRSSFSTNIKERRDFSCALFDREGRMVSQAAHLPVHLGSAPLSVRAAMQLGPFQMGDTVLLNDPFSGGTHLPDITLVTPVFLAGGDPSEGPDLFVANRAHHADVGGPNPGSMGPAVEIHGEGLRLPPVFFARAGELQEDLLAIVRANMRVPDEREGDLLAQWSANRVGERRLQALAAEYGAAELCQRAGGLLDWTAGLAAGLVAECAEAAQVLAARGAGGRVEFEDSLELPGGGRAPIHLAVSFDGPRLVLDFTASSPALAGPVNAPRAVTVSAVLYALRLLLPPGTPTNDGILRAVELRTRPGSLVDATYPAAVSAGNVETSQRLVDVLLGALGQLFPGRVPAASSGTMSNLTFGSRGGAAFAHYETIAGGAGASPAGEGCHAVQTHMTNTRNTPIEALETHAPVRVVRYTVRRGSGGAGRHRGGDGLVRRLCFLQPAHLGWVAQRQQTGPWGLAGGAAGEPGSAWVRRAAQAVGSESGGDEVLERLGGEVSMDLEAGDEVELRTPGGGGWSEKLL